MDVTAGVRPHPAMLHRGTALCCMAEPGARAALPTVRLAWQQALTPCALPPHTLPFPSLVSAFGSGVCFSLVSGMGKPGAQPGSGTANPMMAAFSAGVVFALFQGAFYKVHGAGVIRVRG